MARPNALIVAAASVAASAALVATGPRGPRAAAEPAPPVGTILFQDLTKASGGPYDFGAPVSNVEKATCAFFDADGDGWDDLLSLTGAGQPFLFYLNRDDGAGGRHFVAAPPGHGFDTGPAFERDGSGLAIADVDNDGDEDVYVGCGWNETLAPGLGSNLLFLNDGDGTFTDATSAAGLDDGDNTTCAAVFFDFDLDGDLDLYSCNTDFAQAGKAGDGLGHLYRNELAETGTLRFVEETSARGVVESGKAVWAVSGVDYDNDGDFDLLITHDIFGPTQLFQNDGTGNFRDVTRSAGSGAGDDGSQSTFGDDSYSAMGVAWGDVENDGDLDLYISDVAGDPALNEGSNAFYVNNGNGTFRERAKSSGVRGGWVTWGTTFADFDLDGFVDLYVGGGDLWNLYRPEVRSWIYRNDGDGTFTDVTGGAGLRRDVPLHRENGSATADFDGDGRLDLLVSRAERGGAGPYLYRNVSSVGSRRWIAVDLRGDGTASNTGAIGARVRVVPRDAAGAAIPGLAQIREVQSAESRASRSSRTQHFGLGDAAVSADVEVRWPRAGTLAERTQVYRDVPLDRVVRITEAPREAPWRPDPLHEVVVPSARRTELVCAGAGEPDPLTTLAVEQGPSWVRIGPWADGRTVEIDAPAAAAVVVHDVTLLAVAQGAADPETRQTLRVRVVPAPVLTRARRTNSREIQLDGLLLDTPGLAVTVDGSPLAVKSVKRLKGAGRKTRLVALVPKELRKGLARGSHTVRVVEPSFGLDATAPLRR